MATSKQRPLGKNSAEEGYANQYKGRQTASGADSVVGDMALNQLKNIDDLLNLREHSENAIFNSIRARLKDGNPYTWAGPALISVNPGVPLLLNQDTRRQYDEKSCANMPPHLYSISSSAYKDLLKEEMSQVISLLGHSGSGKTFNLIQLLDHLVWLGSRDALSEQVDADKELFSLLHNGVQALHILGSVVRESNVEGTCCALVVDVSYDSEFRAVGGKIKAKLLDSSLPKPKNGRTYQILHSLLCASKPILQSLGITSNSNYKLLQSKMDSATKAQLRTIDAEIWHRFLECLNNLGIQRKETQSLLQILTAVILCFDLHFVPNSFVKAGQTQDIWEPRNRPVVQKLAKLLETTEGKFLECFGVFATKLEAENRMLDLARMLYKIGFEWLNERINEALALHTKTMVELRINSLSLNLPPAQLREIRQSIEPRHSVSIIDFPGYNDESSLGSFSTNLAIEALNYYCSQNYIKLVAALKSEQISIQHMEIPRCHNIVDLCMGKQGNGLISALSHSYQDFLGYWKLLKNCDAYEEILEIESKTKFNLNFTWGQVNYDISSLRKEAHEHFSQELNYIFIKK